MRQQDITCVENVDERRNMEAVSLLSMLGACSYEDIKSRRIGVILVLGFGILGIFLHLFYSRLSIEEMLGGIAIGLIMFLVSYLSQERIGKGDALVLTVSGIYLGFWNNLFLLWGASLMASFVGIVFIAKGERKRELPFVPFLLVVYVLGLILKPE